MRFVVGLLLAFALVGPCAAETIEIDVPPPAIVPTLEAGATVASVSFTRMAANLVEGTAFVALRDHMFCGPPTQILRWESRLNNLGDPAFERILRAEFTKAGLKISGDQSNLFEEDTKAADLQIGRLSH